MDILDNYRASALSHPVDKSKSGRIQRELDQNRNAINVALYGRTSTNKGTNIFDMMKQSRGKPDV